jgi:hypothetical protein
LREASNFLLPITSKALGRGLSDITFVRDTFRYLDPKIVVTERPHIEVALAIGKDETAIVLLQHIGAEVVDKICRSFLIKEVCEGDHPRDRVRLFFLGEVEHGFPAGLLSFVDRLEPN